MCSTTPLLQATVRPDISAARQARDMLRRSSCISHPTPHPDSAVLLLSEVVTNAVRYGAAPISLSVECAELRGLVVRVSDAGQSLPRLRPVTGADENTDEGGRGMWLVDQLSEAWGVDVTPGGKTVWFRLTPG